MLRRSAGLLLHPTSLPGRFGVGDLGPEADSFVRWMACAGQSNWQVLPLGPTTTRAWSPYACLSAFAGNPQLISPERLVEDGLLPTSVLEWRAGMPPDRADFPAVARWKERLLRSSWKRFCVHPVKELERDLERFLDDPAQEGWLEDWALFAALRRRAGGRSWTSWDEELRRRRPGALRRVRRELAEEIRFHRYVQYLFFRQWARSRGTARREGVRLLGDLPIYVAHDSADVWASQELFQLDERGRPAKVAGVPPDAFSEHGQLWRHPLYRWDRMEERGFTWWIERVRFQLALHDMVRLDHFRGFVAYWEVPAAKRTAACGRWVPGPGARLFHAIRGTLGELPLIAEDLGEITPDVHRLRQELGLPGMKVLQFAFGSPDSEHLLEHHTPNSVVYTGTHDNDTVRGWFDSLEGCERKTVLDYLGGRPQTVAWDMIRAAYRSVARLAVVPLQDVFGLGSEARMNTPGKSRGNWTWRARKEQLREDLAARLLSLAEQSGRTS